MLLHLMPDQGRRTGAVDQDDWSFAITRIQVFKLFSPGSHERHINPYDGNKTRGLVSTCVLRRDLSRTNPGRSVRRPQATRSRSER